MNILIGLGDIGGQRALFPFVETIIAAGHKVFVLNHRFDPNEIHHSVEKMEVVDVEFQIVEKLVKEKKINAYLFSTSVSDKFAIEMAEFLRSKFLVPTICILDNWMNYKVRIELKNNKCHFPTIYCVMDEFARQEAIKAGIPPESLRITGLIGINQIHEVVSRQDLKFESDKKIFLFINEPASIDQGVDSSNPKFRGYNEYEVMNDLFVNHRNFFKKYKILVCPHPRDDVAKLEKYLNEMKTELDISFSPPGNTLRLIPVADGVLGMASIFLFYSWLYQLPTLSYQPNVRLPDLELLRNREGIIFLTAADKLEEGLKRLEAEVQHFQFKIDNKRKIFYEYISPPYNILKILGNL